MVAKKTHEFVEAAFAEEGYQLLDRYEGAHKKMRYICPEGHEHSINWTNFSQGYRCAYCAGFAITPQQVEQAFNAEGYTLIDRYEGSKKKLRFVCPQGHEHSMTWGNFNTGYRCAFCSGRVVTHEQVKGAFEAEGYQLLTQYRNNTTKLKFICPQGHEYQTTWADFKSGCRCAYCVGRRVDHEEVQAAFESAGYTLLSDYGKSGKKLNFICPSGHRHSITWNSFKSGNRCAHCAGKVLTHDEIELAFSIEGYELLDRYVNCNTKMRYICPEGHEHSIAWTPFKSGHRCPYCAGMRPSEEQLKINKIKHGIARLIQVYLRRQSAKKTFSTSTFSGQIASNVFKSLGCRPQDHHLDHIVPQSYFDFRNQHEIEACWDIVNLRYIPSVENAGRGNRLTAEEVKRFSDRQLEILAIASRKPTRFCQGM